MTTYTWDEAKRKSNLRKHELDMKYESSLLDGQVGLRNQGLHPTNPLAG